MTYTGTYNSTNLKDIGLDIAGTGMVAIVDFMYLIVLAILAAWFMEKLGIYRVI